MWAHNIGSIIKIQTSAWVNNIFFCVLDIQEKHTFSEIDFFVLFMSTDVVFVIQIQMYPPDLK